MIEEGLRLLVQLDKRYFELRVGNLAHNSIPIPANDTKIDIGIHAKSSPLFKGGAKAYDLVYGRVGVGEYARHFTCTLLGSSPSGFALSVSCISSFTKSLRRFGNGKAMRSLHTKKISVREHCVKEAGRQSRRETIWTPSMRSQSGAKGATIASISRPFPRDDN